MLKISSGFLKGRNIKVPQEVRPTTSFVRQAIFSILRNKFNLYNKTFGDFFAGAGGMSFEAISNGCIVLSIEKFKKHYTNLKKNFEKLDLNPIEYKFSSIKKFSKLKTLENNSLVYFDSLKFLSFINFKFDIVFLDPPYKSNLGEKILNNDNALSLFHKDSIIFLETSKKIIELDKTKYQISNSKKYGDTFLFIIKIK